MSDSESISTSEALAGHRGATHAEGPLPETPVIKSLSFWLRVRLELFVYAMDRWWNEAPEELRKYDVHEVLARRRDAIIKSGNECNTLYLRRQVSEFLGELRTLKRPEDPKAFVHLQLLQFLVGNTWAYGHPQCLRTIFGSKHSRERLNHYLAQRVVEYMRDDLGQAEFSFYAMLFRFAHYTGEVDIVELMDALHAYASPKTVYEAYQVLVTTLFRYRN